MWGKNHAPREKIIRDPALPGSIIEYGNLLLKIRAAPTN
jgi:hypothetical protein